MRLERGGEREGGGTREVVGKGKAETGRDREGEGDVVLLVAFIAVLLVAFIEVLLVAFIEVLLVALRCTYGSVDGSACGCLTECDWREGEREKGVERGRMWGKGRQRQGGIGKERETWFCWLRSLWFCWLRSLRFCWLGSLRFCWLRCAVLTVAWMVLLAVV